MEDDLIGRLVLDGYFLSYSIPMRHNVHTYKCLFEVKNFLFCPSVGPKPRWMMMLRHRWVRGKCPVCPPCNYIV